MSCYLRIHGNFVPCEVLENFGVGVEPLDVWRKGDIGFLKRIVEEDGMQFLASNAEFTDATLQFEDAVRFLSRNTHWLRPLAEDSRVSKAFLDFALDAPLNPVTCRLLPLNLIRGAAECGVEICLRLWVTPGASDPQRDFEPG